MYPLFSLPQSGMDRSAQHDRGLIGRALKQLEFAFQRSTIHPHAGRDLNLESQARELLRELGAHKLAREIRVEWSPRLKTAAGRADYREKLISLNPLLLNLSDGLAGTESGAGKLDRFNRSSFKSAAEGISNKTEPRAAVNDEIDRTLRHELAHLLAQWREKSRRRIAPHGEGWRQACRDLGIADEARCHNLPFATKSFPPRYVYICPQCKEKFPRVRRIRRAIACLACCRKHNGGEFHPRFRLKLVSSNFPTSSF
jgi:SprT protein